MKKQKTFKFNLGKKIAPILGSRDVIQELDKLIKKAESNLVELDFAKVDFISRSAAHELISLKERLARQSKTISFINTSQDVAKMLRIVAANRALPPKKPAEFKAPLVDIKSLIKA
jgi:anti-anti-sigma regulatory factor